MSIQQITLDLIPNGVMPILYASQYDAGRSFRANLTERKIPYTLDGTELITLTVRKGDNNLVTMDIANTFADKSYIDFLSTEQMCAIAGFNYGELRLEKNGENIGTLNFYLTVEPAADEGGIESESEINNLERQVHEIVIDEIAEDLSHYYTKEETYSSEEIDNALDLKANANDVYNKTEIDTALASKANTSDVNTALALKADKATTYNKTEVDNLVAPKADKSYVDSELATKADSATTYSKTEVDALINALPTPMVFKGTLGTGGTITTLPSASAENEGYTYKVITAGTYQGIVCKVGDVVTSNGSDWVLIPSGDTDSDTWRAIKINGTEKLGNAISTGAVDFEQGDNITITFDAEGNKIIVATTGIYTKAEVDALIADKCDYPTETASGTIASFNTDLASALKECKVSFTAYQASGTPTPETPIPISGFSSATLTRTGANLWDEEYTGGIINTSTGAITSNPSSTTKINTNPIMCKGNTQYRLVKNNAVQFFVMFYDKNGDALQYSVKSGDTSSAYNLACLIASTATYAVFTTPENTDHIYIRMDLAGDTPDKVSINYPSTDMTYHAYNGTSVVIPFGDTYYGGVLDVIRGKLRVTWGFVDLGTLTWANNVAGIFSAQITDLSTANKQKVKCSWYGYGVTQFNWSDVPTYADKTINTAINNYIYIKDTDYSDAPSFKTAVDGVQLVYELATPIEIDLTPKQIATLVGDNNVFCDIPTSSVEVAFKVSIEKYINDLLNP